jgi:hypothetical protein
MGSHIALYRICATSSATSSATRTQSCPRTLEMVRPAIVTRQLPLVPTHALFRVTERQRQKPKKAPRAPSAAGRDGEDSLESADEFRDDQAAPQKKKRVSRRRQDDGDGERQPKLRKRKRAAPPPENLDDLPPELGACPLCLPPRCLSLT